jgi:hypothetical protein
MMPSLGQIRKKWQTARYQEYLSAPVHMSVSKTFPITNDNQAPRRESSPRSAPLIRSRDVTFTMAPLRDWLSEPQPGQVV